MFLLLFISRIYLSGLNNYKRILRVSEMQAERVVYNICPIHAVVNLEYHKLSKHWVSWQHTGHSIMSLMGCPLVIKLRGRGLSIPPNYGIERSENKCLKLSVYVVV